MFWAKDKDNNRIYPVPNISGFCELCNQIVVSKCGDKNIWHWAHKSLTDCDAWFENETDWHRNWKNLVPVENQEVKIGNHRADIFINNKVIELQNSSISESEILERENFYKNMVWILNLTDCNNFYYADKGSHYTFKWNWAKRSFYNCSKPMFIDLGDDYLFKIKKKYSELKYGWGILIPKQVFISSFLK